MKINYIFLCVGLSVLVLSSGCRSTRGGTVYDRRQANTLQNVSYGTVENVLPVIIDGESTRIGRVGGAATGVVLGGEVGGGTGRDLARVGGGIAGAVAGEAAEKALKRKDGFEIQVKLDNGNQVVIIQEADEMFHPGDRVRVLSGAGVARVAKAD